MPPKKDLPKEIYFKFRIYTLVKKEKEQEESIP